MPWPTPVAGKLGGGARRLSSRREAFRRISATKPRGSIFDLIEDEHASRVERACWPLPGLVSPYEARGRVDSGEAHYGTVVQTLDTRRMWRTVSKPCWHTPSWLLPYEIDAALQHFRLDEGVLKFDFRLLRQTVQALEVELGADRVRLVFWFDN